MALPRRTAPSCHDQDLRSCMWIAKEYRKGAITCRRLPVLYCFHADWMSIHGTRLERPWGRTCAHGPYALVFPSPCWRVLNTASLLLTDAFELRDQPRVEGKEHTSKGWDGRDLLSGSRISGGGGGGCHRSGSSGGRKSCDVAGSIGMRSGRTLCCRCALGRRLGRRRRGK